MGMFGSLAKALTSSLVGRQTWTASEVRELIDQGELSKAKHAVEHLSTQSASPDAEKHCLRGEILFQERRDEDALVAFNEALLLSPGMPEAHYGLSLVLAERGTIDDAVRHAQFALRSNQSEARYLAQLGYCHLCLGNYQLAETTLRRATLSMSNSPYLWNNLGIVLRVKGDGDESRQCFERALRIKPEFESAREHLAQLEAEVAAGSLSLALSADNSHALHMGMSELDAARLEPILELERLGELRKAIDAAEALALKEPDDEQMVVLLSRLYERAGDFDSAMDTLRAYLSRRSDAVVVAGALGLLCLRAQDFKLSEHWLRKANRANPDHVDLTVGLGRALAGQERFAEAGSFLRRAAELAPDDISLQVQLASNLANECRYEESLAIIEELNSLGKAVSFKGSVLAYLGRFDEALVALAENIRHQPRDPNLRFQRAQVHLLLENFAEGWDDYKFRGLSFTRNFRMLPFPLWKGEDLEGKKVIVLAEQGLGDQVMFASCVPDLLAMKPARVVFEMIDRVAETLARSFPECDVRATAQDTNLDWVKDYPDTDYFIPLADLPAHVRRDHESFPKHHGYLKADPEKVDRWRRRLEAAGPGPYIGLSWRGGTEMTRTVVRSLHPEEFLPLTHVDSIRNATWVCLQYGPVTDQLDKLKVDGWPIQYWAESISDLDEFAALISALDLVVTVCNTTVHYAGALGKPVWIVAPKVPEWRYGLFSSSLPWYPSSRIWRQSTAGDWNGPIASIERELSLVGIPPS